MRIVYQPVVGLASGTIIGVEALARFDEEKESPMERFARAVAEGKGVELEIQAIELALQGFHPKDPKIFLAVNISAPTLIATGGELIRDCDMEVPWSQLVAEVTEHQRITSYLPLDKPFQVLRQRGARIAIDDVGAGFSGLVHISEVLPHVLKIDQALTQNVNHSPNRRALIRGLTQIALEMHATTVAEGIETEAEKDWCAELGVDAGQGYYFGRPVPFSELPW